MWYCSPAFSDDRIVIVKTLEFKALMKQFGEAFEQYHFTVLERQIPATGVNPMQYFASRLAAKIAILKTLGLEGNLYPLWQDIEIQRLPTGEPIVVLYANCQERAIEQSIERWLLSISHTPCYAAASAIALCNH